MNQSQCVPSWDIEEALQSSGARVPTHSNPNGRHHVTSHINNSQFNYEEVAELTWQNGQLGMHCMGLPKIVSNRPTPATSGTLESVVNQATFLTPLTDSPPPPSPSPGGGDELGSLFKDHRNTTTVNTTAIIPPTTMSLDALVPCSRTCVKGNSTRVESCSGAVNRHKEMVVVEEDIVMKPAKRVRGALAREEGSSHSGMESRHVGVEMRDIDFDVGLTSTSFGSHDYTLDELDSLSHSRTQRDVGAEDEKNDRNGKSSVSTKRSRAAEIHNQSERKRRDKINQRMKTLQKLVPNASKTDKASMLDEVIEYLKQLQAQVQMMSRMNMPQMMMPMTMQQQLQMTMMAQMGMGMNMGMGMGVMDMNSIARPNIPGIPPVLNPAAFMAMASLNGITDRVPSSSTVMPDPMASLLASTSQPINLDAYNRMAALYQQIHQQQQLTNSKT